jgi:hypothetical protein
MTKYRPERIAVLRHVDAIARTIATTEADYDADGNLTEEAWNRLTPAILPHLSAAERRELAEAGLEDIIDQALNGLVAEGRFEKFTDEAGDIRFRMRHASSARRSAPPPRSTTEKEQHDE